jgi:putative PIN family toxin of toxin-antitoxin system
MKVVIDTSVWISALINKDGFSREVIKLALKDIIYPQINMPLFIEYESVSKREEIVKLTPLSQSEYEELFSAFISTMTWNEIYYLWRPNLKDKDDDFLVELAVASNAKYIITENKKDFIDSELKFGFKVLKPSDFLKEIKI